MDNYRIVSRQHADRLTRKVHATFHAEEQVAGNWVEIIGTISNDPIETETYLRREVQFRRLLNSEPVVVKELSI